MSRTNLFLTVLATIALPLSLVSGTSLAQETTTQPAEETAQEAPAGDEGLALGEPIDETRTPGSTYIRETVGDWSVRCVVVESGDDRCQLYQLLEDANGQPMAEFTMLKIPEGGQARAAATIIVPLETSLQNQLSIKVDQDAGKRYPFSFCNTIGCYARIGLTQEDVDGYKRGSQALLSIVPMAAPDVKVEVTLSLTGFTAAFDGLEDLPQGN